jgi:16S rRNA (uracil1498-N3)-methyltransferase
VNPRCHVPEAEQWPETVELDRATSHHLVRVLRVTPGAAVTLFNGRGASAEAEVLEAGRSGVTVRVRRRRTTPPVAPHVTLVQALIRPQPMDSVFRKATEIGASAIQPVITARCVARTRERPDRWQKTLVSAAEQCGIDWLPVIEPVRTWSEFLATTGGYDALLLCSLDPAARPLKEVLRGGPAAVRWAALVGPEGDFTPGEAAAAQAAGAVPVSLGCQTLRAETAALYVLACLRYEFAAPVGTATGH